MMVQLYSLGLACLVGFAVAQNTALFSDECCSKKNVGGVDYTQVPGNTTDFPACKPGCVYEKDDESGSRYCFATADITTGLPVECTESTSSARMVSVTRDNDKIIFQSPGLLHSCDILSSVTDSEFEETNCTHTVSEQQASETGETATLITSFSSTGSLEWISLQTDQEWIHCDFSTNTHYYGRPASHIVAKNTLFVEGAEAISNQGASLANQLTECRTKCESASCNFWTFSYYGGRTSSHSRGHNERSECGLRSYDACCVIPTNKDQWFGIVKDFPHLPKAPYTQRYLVAVWRVAKNISLYQCYDNCLRTPGCTTWTWVFHQNTCSANNYTPTRKIDIGSARPQPNLYSGCFNCGGL